MRRSLAAAAAACVAAASCRDGAATLPAPHTVSGTPHATVGSVYPDWKGYWRTPDTLWVYDNTPEMGINSAILTYEQGRPQSYAAQIHNDLGIRLVRYGVHWSAMEPTPGQRDNSVLGGPVVADSAVGNEMVVSVADAPPDVTDDLFSSFQNAASRARFNARFADFMYWIVSTNPNVRFWQLWNEPDAGCMAGLPFWGDSAGIVTRTTIGSKISANGINRRVQGRHYAEMLDTVYRAVKRANPNAVVLSAAFTGAETLSGCSATETTASWDFLDGVYRGGGRNHFDILAINSYGATVYTDKSLLSNTSTITSRLPGWGDTGRELWVTETGSAAISASMDGYAKAAGLSAPQAKLLFDTLQSGWYRDALNVLRGQHTFAKMLGWTFYSPEGGHDVNSVVNTADTVDYGFGILRDDRVTHKPAYDYLMTQAGQNAAVQALGTRSGSFRVLAPGYLPVSNGYDYDGEGDYLWVNGIGVNTLVPTAVPFFKPFDVQVHSSTYGWLAHTGNDQVSGWSLTSQQVEAFTIAPVQLPAGTSVCYQAHLGGGSWQPEVCNGAVAGTTGLSTPIDSVKMRLVNAPAGWALCYQPFNQEAFPWACNGGSTGTYPIRQLRIRLFK